MTEEEEKAAATQTKGAYKMLGGAAVSIFVTPFMFIYSALTSTASMASLIAGGVLIGSSFATKAIDNANKEGIVKTFANQATKYLGEYGAKLIIAGVAIQYPLYIGFALMVEGAGNILTTKDSMGLIPSANWISKEIGKAIQGKAKTVQQQTAVAVETVKKEVVLSENQEKQVTASPKKDSPKKRSMLEMVIGGGSSNEKGM